MSVIREEIVEEQRGRHGVSQVKPRGREGEQGGGGEAAIETVLMKVLLQSCRSSCSNGSKLK